MGGVGSSLGLLPIASREAIHRATMARGEAPRPVARTRRPVLFGSFLGLLLMAVAARRRCGSSCLDTMTKAWPKYSAAISSRPRNEPKRTGRLVRATGRGASPRAMVAR